MIYGDKCDGTLWKAWLFIGLIIVFLGYDILGDGPSECISWFCEAGWGKIGWPSEVSNILMGFLKNNHVA